MPLKIPALDDRDYSDLVAEAIAMIPRYAPSWTNHNPSDPGITLIELLAYFTEMLIYRLDRVGLENKINFLKLLIGSKAVHKSHESLTKLSVDEIDELLRVTVLNLNQPKRAITEEDFEYLAKQAVRHNFKDINDIRAHCIFGKNLDNSGHACAIERPGHVSVVLVAGKRDLASDDDGAIQELDETHYGFVTREVQNVLESKCLLTTRPHVVKPVYIWILISASLQSRGEYPVEFLQKLASDRISRYLSPFKGGSKDGMGWPLGRNLYLSEIIDVLEQIPEIDFIDNTRVLSIAATLENLSHLQTKLGIQVGVCSSVGIDTILGISDKDTNRLILDGKGKLTGIKLKPFELIKVVFQVENPKDNDFIVSEDNGSYV